VTAFSPYRISLLVIVVAFVVMGTFHMATLLLTALFAYLALTKLYAFKRFGKWFTVAVFLIAVAGIAYAVGYFINQAVRALPEIADRAIPPAIEWGKQHQLQLPFTDFDSLKDLGFDAVTNQVGYLRSFARIAKGATSQFVFFAVGCIVAIGLFFNGRLELDRDSRPNLNNLYSLVCEEIGERFATLYRSFATVIGAQIIISAVNTVLTAIFAIAVGLPYGAVVIGFTFLCGLLPVVGNLISNTIIVAIGLTISPKMAVVALIFLIVVHKLEYILNSKVIGDRIRNPLWLTLLGLVIGEKLMGVPGMILAPVVLHYIKLEASRVVVADRDRLADVR
jgi:predicted PurR-regulated permease PerM